MLLSATRKGSPLSSSDEAQLIELLLQLPEEDLRDIEDILDMDGPPPCTLSQLLEKTVSYQPSEWQYDLCRRVEPLVRASGKRIGVHAPPQVGKSTVVQRLLAYCLGVDPTCKNKLACYNISRSTEHSKVLLNILRDPEFKALFPSTVLQRQPSADGWYTTARMAVRDAQFSFQPLGLLTGFVGQGVDPLLVIDDPYASAADAYNDNVNAALRLFWEDTASPRLKDANVLALFHKYSNTDFLSYLEEEGGWDIIRYAAVWDGRGVDPVGREDGKPWPYMYKGYQLLSPLLLKDKRLLKMLDSGEPEKYSVFMSQYQGTPVTIGGGMIRSKLFKIITEDRAPKFRGTIYDRPVDGVGYLKRTVLGVDVAVTAKTSADWTVAMPVGIDEEPEPNYYAFNPFRCQSEWPEARRGILDKAKSCRASTIFCEKVATSAALVQDLRNISNITVRGITPGTDKDARIQWWLTLLEEGRIYLVDDGSGWIDHFLKICDNYVKGAKKNRDDDLDALGMAIFGMGWLSTGNQRVAGKVMYRVDG